MHFQDDDDDSNDDDDEDLIYDEDETALEGYTTPIDDEEADDPIDEYIAFQQVMTSMFFSF